MQKTRIVQCVQLLYSVETAVIVVALAICNNNHRESGRLHIFLYFFCILLDIYPLGVYYIPIRGI